MIHARCLCGSVAYELDAPVERISHCHCSRCRKAHGTAFASYAEAPAKRFRFTRGEEAIVRPPVTGAFPRPFCGRCGSIVPGGPYDDRVFVPAGPLEGDVGAPPMTHIFVGSKAPWYEIEDDLPRYETYPEELGVAAMPDRTPTDPPGRVRGSCLCDAVGFVVEGPFLRAANCHCMRCRRGRAAAHASNLFAPSEGIRFTRGTDRVGSYKVPEADRFTQFFCTTCGSKLPRPGASPLPVAIPMGALDDEPPMRPQGHIFVGSKAPWFRISGALPQFQEYPPSA